MRKFTIATMVLAGVLAAPVGSSVPQRPHFVMAMSMYDGDRLIAEPRLEIVAGEAAGIVVEPGDGSAYKANIVVDPQDDGRLKMSGQFAVKSAATGSISATPMLVLKPGERGTVMFGNDGAGFRPFRAEMIFSSVSR